MKLAIFLTGVLAAAPAAAHVGDGALHWHSEHVGLIVLGALMAGVGVLAVVRRRR